MFGQSKSLASVTYSFLQVCAAQRVRVHRRFIRNWSRVLMEFSLMICSPAWVTIYMQTTDSAFTLQRLFCFTHGNFSVLGTKPSTAVSMFLWVHVLCFIVFNYTRGIQQIHPSSKELFKITKCFPTTQAKKWRARWERGTNHWRMAEILLLPAGGLVVLPALYWQFVCIYAYVCTCMYVYW